MVSSVSQLPLRRSMAPVCWRKVPHLVVVFAVAICCFLAYTSPITSPVIFAMSADRHEIGHGWTVGEENGTWVVRNPEEQEVDVARTLADPKITPDFAKWEVNIENEKLLVFFKADGAGQPVVIDKENVTISDESKSVDDFIGKGRTGIMSKTKFVTDEGYEIRDKN